jgi:hypothetical protein
VDRCQLLPQRQVDEAADCVAEFARIWGQDKLRLLEISPTSFHRELSHDAIRSNREKRREATHTANAYERRTACSAAH